MSWDAARKRVNETAILTVTAEPNSYVSVGAVDQSVLLLSESNDITVDRVSVLAPVIFYPDCVFDSLC